MKNKKNKSLINTEIKLSDKEQEAVAKVNNLLAAKKNMIFELSVQIRNANIRLDAEFTELKKLEEELYAEASKAAKDHGIDVSDPSKGTWTLNTDNMTFIKTS